jgi:hypothetical protein
MMSETVFMRTALVTDSSATPTSSELLIGFLIVKRM